MERFSIRFVYALVICYIFGGKCCETASCQLLVYPKISLKRVISVTRKIGPKGGLLEKHPA